MYYSLSTHHVLQSLNFKQKYKKNLLHKKTTIQNSLKEKNDVALRKCNVMYNINHEDCTDIWNEIKSLSQEYMDIKDELEMVEIYTCHKIFMIKLFQLFNNKI